MNVRAARLFELQHERYLVQAYGPLCAAAGFDISQFSGTDCYAIATQIMGAAKSRARVITKGTFCETDYIGALKSMSAAELSELRARIRHRPMRSSR